MERFLETTYAVEDRRCRKAGAKESAKYNKSDGDMGDRTQQRSAVFYGCCTGSLSSSSVDVMKPGSSRETSHTDGEGKLQTSDTSAPKTQFTDGAKVNLFVSKVTIRVRYPACIVAKTCTYARIYGVHMDLRVPHVSKAPTLFQLRNRHSFDTFPTNRITFKTTNNESDW